MEIAEPEQQQLGRYRIERTLGAGGMGVVYLAHDTKLHRPVAIKKLRDDATSATARARIQSEAQLLARLNHSNIVQLYDVLEERDGIALVMEYVEGTTLKQWMREASPSLRDKLSLLIQLCHGLTEAHSLGIIHRDLKPDNILITRGGADGFTAKITDFGIAKSLQADESITREDHVAGTVEVMSPEQLQGYPLCPRSDLFSLGTIAYELLCGSRPFDKGDRGENGPMALAQRVVHDPHTPPQQANPDLPEPFAALLDRLLSKNPEQRPESAEQVAEALGFLRTEGSNTITGDYSETVTRLLRKPPNKRKRLLATLAGLVVLGSAGYWGWKEITKLEPQYIAVLPVQIEGEIRGGQELKSLTKTMVKQALIGSTLNLKTSALVAYEPEKASTLETQLSALRDKGATGAISAKLDCAQQRCDINIELINPANEKIINQAGFTILPLKRPESSYRISSAARELFTKKYRKETLPPPMQKDDYDTYLAIASRIENKNSFASDEASLVRLLNKYPTHPNLYRAVAWLAINLYIANNNLDFITKGLVNLERAKAHNVDQALILELEFLLKSQQENPEGLDRMIADLQALDFPSASLLTEYARLLYRKGDHKESLQIAKDASVINPTPESLYLLGINQYIQGEYEKSINTLMRCITLNPQHWSSQSLLASIFVEQGDYFKGEQVLLKIPAEQLTWYEHTNFGTIYFFQKKYKKALQSYNQALIISPDNATTLGNIADTYLSLGDHEAARETFLKLKNVTASASDAEGKKFFALSLAYLGEIDPAIKLTHALIQEYPNNTNIKYMAAQIYALAGENRSASYYIEELINQGMDREWFSLPVFSQACVSASAAVKAALCQ
ncbi:serine/threonine protein kinase [Microbulbifer flavimaris]|uniref:Serine/threonine protein kinase n=1 Tax=Microbulbifer flavimaris TaxID=1781068 RepID=A0ABX4HZT6_9GAMM|nr:MULTISPECIES: serine/threonine-protein kinase [Microbulbifer]KUJ83509.1 hypothetical protein AVO43_06525 [Microbulbifer sp. ZGT114]PCO05670.1 serine/threonine protein kinase [Microbulbifer flavimaris]